MMAGIIYAMVQFENSAMEQSKHSRYCTGASSDCLMQSVKLDVSCSRLLDQQRGAAITCNAQGVGNAMIPGGQSSDICNMAWHNIELPAQSCRALQLTCANRRSQTISATPHRYEAMFHNSTSIYDIMLTMLYLS